jgi:small subunit ribosomal protein S20
MAHTRTSRKNIRKNARQRERNKAALSAMRTQIKKVRQVAQQGDEAALQAELAKAQKALDKSAKKNRIHKNKAARAKSRLVRSTRTP